MRTFLVCAYYLRARILNLRISRTCIHMIKFDCVQIAMECFNLSNPTGSSQSQQPSSYENQPPKKQRKRGIAALLSDISNEQQPCAQRVSKEVAETKITASFATPFDTRGDPVKGAKEKATVKRKTSNISNDTLYCIYTNQRELF